uniref:Uncharacterized protein n=1 Tax=Lepeophtheirus salmonis TaxID=72036 RepID=A0A0K2UN91_LEPSM
MFGDGTCQHCGGRRSITGFVIRVTRHVLNQLSTNILKLIFQLNCFGHGHSVLGDLWGTPRRFNYHISPTGSHRHGHRIRKDVHSLYQLTLHIHSEADIFRVGSHSVVA